MNLNKEIWRLAAPAIVSNVTVPLLGLCDTTVAGHFGSPEFIAAIAVGATMANTLFWVFGFLRMGTSGLTAQVYGAHNMQLARKLMAQASAIGFLIGLTLLCLRLPLGAVLIKIMNPDTATAPMALTYFTNILWGAPPMLSTMAMMGWMLGMQNSKSCMIVAITTNVFNLALSLTFVYVLKMGIGGIAFGTSTANWLGLFLAIFMAKRIMPGEKFWCGWKEVLSARGLGRFFSVNIDIMLRSMCIMVVSASVTAIGARMGALTLACNAVMMQFFTIFSYFMDGVAFAGEALCGRFAGERSYIKLKNTVIGLLKWGGGFAIIFSVAYLFGYMKFAEFITNQPQVLAMVAKYSIWLKFIPIITVAAFVFDGIYIGLTATRKMLLATFGASIIFFLMAFLNLHHGKALIEFPENNRLWGAFLSYLLTRGVALAAMTPRELNISISYHATKL